jgi:hypothetical protein
MLAPERRRRLRWLVPLILSTAVIGLAGEALGLRTEQSLTLALAWQGLLTLAALTRG